MEIRAEIAKYKQDLKSAESATTASANSMRTSLSAVRTALGTIGIVTGAVAAIAKLVQLGKESVELASDLQEVQNVVDTVFGNMSGEIDSFATDAITQFGLSQTAAKQFASTMGAILKSMGFRGQELSDMSTNLAGLAGDLASFYNIDAETAFQKLRAGITGEIEPLRQLGINLSQANLEQFRLSRGITTAYNAMTEQEKALLRYQYILEATGDAQGDFSRTSGGWANQVRVMREQINAIKAEIGSGLMEILLPIVRGINWLLSQVIRGLQALRRFFSRGKGGTASMDTMTDATAALTSEANAAAGAVGGIGKAAKSAAKAFTTASFDELHQLASDAASAAGGGGGGGGGIGGLVGDLEEELAGLNQMTGKAEEGESAIRSWARAWYDAQQKVGNEIARAVDKIWRSNKLLNYSATAEESRIRGELISQAAYGQVRQNGRKFLNGVKSFITGSNDAREGLRRFNEAAVGGWHDIGVALGLLGDEAEDSTERVSGAFVGAQEKVTSSTYTIEALIKKLAGDPSLKTLQKNIGGVGTKASAAAAEVGEAESAISEHLRLMNMHAEKPISELTGKETSIGTGMTAAAAVVKDAATGKSGSVTASLSAMNTDGGKSVTALGTTITGLGTSAKSAATEVKAQTVGASGSVKAFLNTMKSDGSTAVEGLRSAITTKMSDAAKSASSSSSSIKQSVVDAVNSTKTELSAQKFTDVGQNIKNGLIAGMGDFKNQLNTWANQFKDQILKNFQIKSPSKWAENEAGWFLGLGVARGLEDSLPRIAGVTGMMKDTIADGLAAPELALSGSAAGVSAWDPGRGTGWIDLLATTIARSISSANSDQPNAQPTPVNVYLDGELIASTVTRRQRSDDRRYNPVAVMA